MMTFLSQNLLDAFRKSKAEELMQNVRSNLESSVSKMLFYHFSDVLQLNCIQTEWSLLMLPRNRSYHVNTNGHHSTFKLLITNNEAGAFA